MMEEYSRKRKAKKDDEDEGEEAIYPSHDFDNVVQGGIDVQLVIPEKPNQGDNPNSSKNDSIKHDDDT
jgi:hypothetical protein